VYVQAQAAMLAGDTGDCPVVVDNGVDYVED